MSTTLWSSEKTYTVSFNEISSIAREVNSLDTLK